MKAKILTNLNEKMQGVMGRDSLDEDEVYIFLNVFPSTGFHMQTVMFPIDIAFLDKDFGILGINEMEPDTGRCSAPDKTYYAVEASKGFFNKNNLKSGDVWKEVANLIQIKEK